MTTRHAEAGGLQPPRRLGWWLAVALVAGSPCLVGPAFFSPFMRYDDEKIILQNPLAREGFTAQTIEQVARPPLGAFRGYYAQYIPLTYLGLGLQYRLCGERAWTFRLANLLFHLGSALLLYRIILALRARGRTGESQEPRGEATPAAAAFGAALFFFHPTNVESVAWAAERNNVQSLFFAMLSWWLLLERGRRGWALVAFGAALLSKPMAVGFAPLLIFSELLLRPEARGRRQAWCAACGALAAFAALLAYGASPGNLLPLTGGSVLSWALTSVSVLGRALAHVFAPVNLSFFYAVAPVHGLADAYLALAALLVAWLWWTLRRLPVDGRYLVVFGLGGLLTLAPVMSPRTISFLYQDRFIYFALPAFAALAVLAWQAAKRRMGRLGLLAAPVSGRLAAAAAALLIALLAGLALRRAGDFRDTDTLFADAAAKQPYSFYAQFMLAHKLLVNAIEPQVSRAERQVILYEALTHMRRANHAVDQDRHQDPGQVWAVEGEILWRLGYHAPARGLLLSVVEQQPPSPRPVVAQAHWILAEIAKEEYLARGDPYCAEEAVAHLEKVLRDYADAAYAWHCLGQVLEKRGHHEQARRAYQRARHDPFYAAYAEAALKRLK